MRLAIDVSPQLIAAAARTLVVQRNFQTYRQPALNSLAAARNLGLMTFLSYPRLSLPFAQFFLRQIEKGGRSEQIVRRLMVPLTQAFSAGDDIPQALDMLNKMHAANGPKILLDYVDEMLEDPNERKQMAQNFLDLLEAAKDNPHAEFFPLKMTALIRPLYLSHSCTGTELSASQLQEYQEEMDRLETVVEKAHQLGKIIFVDQEYPTQAATIFNLAEKLMEKYNRERAVVYITIQATDSNCAEKLSRIFNNPQIKFPGIKLVNGAYVSWARNNNFGHLVQSSKSTAFLAYATILKICIRHNIRLFMGTHNTDLESLAHLWKDQYKYPENRLLIGQLYGFTTKRELPSMYAIFGAPGKRVDYSLRRVLEGAEHCNQTAKQQLTQSDLAEVDAQFSPYFETKLADNEVATVARALNFDVQNKRIEVARSQLRSR